MTGTVRLGRNKFPFELHPECLERRLDSGICDLLRRDIWYQALVEGTCKAGIVQRVAGPEGDVV
jgi:hypothetical protein